MAALNDAFRFVLGLCSLAALAYWGFRAEEGGLQWLLGLGAPLAFAAAWGVLLASRAPMRLEDPLRLPAEIALFGVASAALAVAEPPALGLALAAAVALHLVLTFRLGQR